MLCNLELQGLLITVVTLAPINVSSDTAKLQLSPAVPFNTTIVSSLNWVLLATFLVSCKKVFTKKVPVW